MPDLLLATRNRGKLNELAQLLAGMPLRVLSLADVGITDEVEETGNTFADNAVAKAIAYSRIAASSAQACPEIHPAAHEPPGPEPLQGSPERPGPTGPAATLTLADDSGLVVDALGGAPGVLSARYGGTGHSDEERCRLLLKELESVPREERTARFVCVLALARAGRLIRTFEGVVEGLIALEPCGSNGFGYDPVFYCPPLGRAFSELSSEEKDRVSHRGRALRLFVEYAVHPGFLAENSIRFDTGPSGR